MTDISTAGPAPGIVEQWGLKVAHSLARARDGVPGGGDWALWHRACAGDARCARTLVGQLMPQAYGIAMQILRKNEDAQDVVQDSFLRLWSSQPSDMHGARLSTYFNTIVINRCKTLLTRRHELSTETQVLTDLADAQQQDSADLPDCSPAISAQQLQCAMAVLPARQRMALVMWAYADADAADIGRALEIETNAAHQLLYRAKSALRTALQGDSR
jgi:RNA polymerase sigma-70 factor, ECF subfamily